MKKVFFASVVAALSLLLFSCSNFFSSSSPDNDSIAPNGKALVHFSVGKSGARTIMPLDFTANDVDMIYLSAEKLSPENEYVPYEFSEGLTSLSWRRDDAPDENVIARFQESTIALEYGTYNLKLDLCEEVGEGSYKMIQSGEIKAQPINANTELTFIMEYKNWGDISISISWGFDGDTNRIGKIDAGLYTIASKGETPLDITGDTAEKTLTITEDGSSATATGSFSSVNNGSYLIKLRLYDTETAENPFNIITDIIKVNGYKTLYNLALDLDKLNIQYTAIFNPNGGTWVGGSTGRLTTTRNMYSGFVPPEGVSKTGFELVGWYVFEDDEDDVPSEDLSKATPSDRLAPDEDYTFYAVWGHSVGGNFTTDNRALIIKTDAGDKIYQNSKINLSVTDSAGEPVTDGVTYDAKILYKGKDINDLGGKTYYTVEGGVITLNGMTTPLPEAKYQLYVTASRLVAGGYGEPVTSSQTFNVKLLDGVETQIALYNKSSGAYNYYLKDSDKVDEELGEQTLDANMAKSAFDASGYFYVAYKDNYGSDGVRIFSTNPVKPSGSDVSLFKSGGVQLPLKDDGGTSYSYYYQDFAIDLTTNILYGCAVNMTSLYLFKYPNLISSASTEGCVAYDCINVSEGYFYPSQIAINDNTLYVFGYWTDNDDESDNEKWQVMVYDIPESESFGEVKYTCDLDSMLTTADSKLSYAKYRQTGSSSPYGDMYAMDGALYLVLKPFTAWTVSNPNIYSGAIVKWVPGESEVTVRGLYAEKTVAQQSIKEMYFNTERGAPPTVYSDSGHSELKTMLADSTSFNTEEHSYGYADGYKFFPNVYAMSAKSLLLDKTGFVGPAKIIGIKPKKLVIADDGYAFYTDSDMLYYKNVNRVVTIDLEDFVIESVQLTKATFDSELTDYFKSATTIRNIITSAGTYYDYEASVYYFDGSSNAQSGTIDAENSNLYLAVKEGAAE